jgi:hypothetical protein
MAQNNSKYYCPTKIAIQHNKKTGEAGTIDVHRGCPGCELKDAPCYAAKGAARVGINFFHPVKRPLDEKFLSRQLKNYSLPWIRVGCISDPSLNWKTSARVCEILHDHGKTPVIVTKIYTELQDTILTKLLKSEAIVQVSTSALASNEPQLSRLINLFKANTAGLRTSLRLNTAKFPQGNTLDAKQEELIILAAEAQIPILETPIRLFRTSPLWNLVDQSQYHRHLSPISGRLDNQRTAGLLIPNAWPCFSSCATGPSGNDPVGCPHQCLTIGDSQWRL